MRILLDCDGVISNFQDSFLGVYTEVTGNVVHPDSLTTWHFTETLPATPTERYQIRNLTHARGFCLGLAEYPGAVSAVRKLMTRNEVVFVTSPLDSHHWAFERQLWLQARFGADCKVVSTKHKECVAGSYLIDDNPNNVELWENTWCNGGGRGVLWSAPYNRNVDTFVARANGWDDVLRSCK